MQRLIKTAAAASLLLMAVSCGKDNPVIQGPVIGGPDTGGSDQVKVGDTLPAWKEGEMDIHFINTTTGESIFIIGPDGTQMLIDAAGSQVATGKVNSTTNTGIRSRWDPTKGSERVGQFITDYIKHCQQWTGNSKIDYVLLTHFHNDHFGGAASLPVSANSSTYTRQSLPEVMDNFTLGTLVDRGYPDYNYPFDMQTKADNAANVKNYVNAVKWHVANKGLKAEKFRSGVADQFTLKYKASSYPTFKVQNLCVNGEVWTGTGTSTTMTFPTLENIRVADPANVLSSDLCPEENHCSCMIKLSYGNFDLYSAGDAQYDGMSSYPWKDIETPVAKVCGRVEVMKADHHGTANTNGYGFKDTAWAMKYLQPQCWIVNSWTDGHPRQATFEGVTSYVTGIDAYITNTCSAQTVYSNWTRNYRNGNGHVVVRVADGGIKYKVYVLTDSDKSYTIKYISGDYTCR